MLGDINYTVINVVRNGSLRTVKLMINSYGLSHWPQWLHGYKLLVEALKENHTKVARFLLISGAKVNSETTYPVETALHFAAKNNDLEIVNMLLERNANVNAVDNAGNTPLHEAVAKGNAEIVSVLLKNKANVETRTTDGKTPLHIATQHNHVQVAEYLLNAGACVDATYSEWSKKGYTSLHCASERGYETLVKLLLNKGADINATTEDKSTSLHIAAEKKREKVVKVLLEHGGADILARSNDGKILLPLAVEKEDLFTVTHILELCPQMKDDINILSKVLYGDDKKTCRKVYKTLLGYEIIVNSEDAKNDYLLHAAVEKGRLKIIEELLKLGADVNSKLPDNKGSTPLHNAVKNNQLEAAKILINNGADVNVKAKCGKLPIFYAIDKDNVDMIKLLLASGSKINKYKKVLRTIFANKSKKILEIILEQSDLDINAIDRQEQTILHRILWMRACDVTMMKMILDKGANVNAKDKDEKTPLHVACEEQNGTIVATLLEYGAGIDIRDRKNDAPLHIAALRGSLDVVKILLEHFADIDCRDESGKTALHIAAINGWPRIVDTLVEYGSDVNCICSYDHTPLYYALDGARVPDRNLDEDDEYGRPPSRGSSLNDFVRVVDTLRDHVVKIKALNLYLNPRNLESTDTENEDEYKDFYNECKYEVEELKNVKIGNTNVTYNDLLTKGLSQLATYARNKSIVEILESGSYKDDFSIYGDLININFKKGQKRESLLNSSLKSLKILTGFVLPDVFSVELLSYLSNKDLNNLTKAHPDILNKTKNN